MDTTHSNFSQVVLATTGILIAVFLYSWKLSSSRSHPLPPGPKGHWFFGIKKQLPRQEPWKTYASWAKSYEGEFNLILACSVADRASEPIISFQIYNRTVIVLNDVQAVSDLLEKRASNYSDRPEQYMSHVVCGRSKTAFNVSSQDPRHKSYRKLLQQGLGSKSTKTYWHILQEELDTLLGGLANSPQKYIQHVRR